MGKQQAKKRSKTQVKREARLRFLQSEENALWYFLPPPHPLAGLYSGLKPLRRAGVYVLPPCSVPEEERRGFAQALAAWFRHYPNPPAVGLGEVLYRPEDYPPELKEMVQEAASPHSETRKRVLLKVRADGSKAKSGGFGALVLEEKGVVGSLQGGVAAEGLNSNDLELLALAHALVLGLALNRPFLAESDSKGLVDRLLLTEKTGSPLEKAARALMEVGRDVNLFRGLRYLPRENNEGAHRLANGGRRALEREQDELSTFLLALPLAYRAWALRYLRRLSSSAEQALEVLARWRGETAKVILAAAKEDPEGFARALKKAGHLSEEEAEAWARRLFKESMDGLPPTPKQAAFLKVRGVDPTGMTRAEASRWIQKFKGE